MREELEPMFGEWGAQILQFLITAAIVIALLALAYWLVRRYSLGGAGRHSRSKVPRLTIVDAMPVDGRRRLLLVRRDNVEHLILVGGPSDVVVEQSIVRQRRPRPSEGEQPPTQMASSFDAAPPNVAENPPVAFQPPQLRAPAPPPEPVATPAQTAGMNGTQAAPERNFSFRRLATAASAAPAPSVIAHRAAPAPEPTPSAARYVDLHRPTRIEAPLTQTAPEPEADPLFPDLPTSESDLGDAEPADALMNGAGDSHHAPREPSPFAKPLGSGEDTAAKVSDLEREMARLLGEITQKRTS
jgi:flagellar protein FliO/FliZ